MSNPSKRCSQCLEQKPADAFGSRHDRPYLLRSWCRACEAERNRRTKKSLPSLKLKRGIAVGYKLVFGCVDCGYSDDPNRLHFDHRPGTEKCFNPSEYGLRLERLVAEWAKCEVRCISCHIKRHHRHGDHDRKRDERGVFVGK